MKNIFCLIFLVITITVQSQKVVGDTIPFTNQLGLIVVPISFNGVDYHFAFDTGATHSLGFSWVKQQLKATRKTITITSSSAAKSKMRYYKSGKIEFGSRKISNHRILGGIDSNIFSCHGIDGILGVDIIALFNWTINYKEKYLVMYPATFYPENVKEMYPLTFDFSNKRPSVFLTINSSRIKFLLDTGATVSDLNNRRVTLSDSLNYPSKNYYSAFFDVNGTLTKVETNTIDFPNVTSNKVKLSPVLSYSTKGSKLGNSLWKSNTLFMSLKNDELYSAVQEINERRTGYDAAVFFDKGKMIVLRILVGSEAWEKGLRQGTEVKTINGTVFTNFCELDQFQRALFKAQKEMTLELTNGGIIKLDNTILFE